uniref:Major facilitator superfamily domain-containing protein 12 n=1 Tax=Panagrellus redivivus TaxID=6233 RepID=A0A7E4W2W1_PANRE
MTNDNQEEPLIVDDGVDDPGDASSTQNGAVIDGVDNHPPEISRVKVFGFSLGHMFNDMCASMWFTYLMIYLEKVLKMRSWRAGTLMLIGQVTDGLATPLIGVISDSKLLPQAVTRFGHRIPWHFVGFILVAVSFPFVFNSCLLCTSETSENWKLIYYTPLIMCFQIGWASMQVNHLALIPSLAHHETCQRTLSTSRLAASVLSNLAVFLVLFIRFTLDQGEDIGPSDLPTFRTLALFVVAVGSVLTILFYILTREPAHNSDEETVDNVQITTSSERLGVKEYFTMPRFFTIGVIYMLTRLYGNLSQVYFPLYITMTLNLHKKYLGILPMISYIFCFAVYSFLSSKCVNQKISRLSLLFAGSFVALIASVLLYFKLPFEAIYITAAVMGIAQSLLLSSAFAFCNFLIGSDKGSSAFIYGSMSFADKVLNGVAFQLIELWNPSCNPHAEHEDCSVFYRSVMVFIPGACAAVLGLLGAVFLTARIHVQIAYDNTDRSILLRGGRQV